MSNANTVNDIEWDNLRADVSHFLNHEEAPAAEEQLEVMSQLWKMAGYEVPQPSEEQRSAMSAHLKGSQEKRVFPAPLLDSMPEREIAAYSLAEVMRLEVGSRALDTYMGCESMLSKLIGLEDPEAIGERRPPYIYTGSFVRGYKIPSGEIVGRGLYREALLEAGQAFEGPDGKIWAFPAIGIQPSRAKASTGLTARDLYGLISPVATPEAHIVARQLGMMDHGVDGKPKDRSKDCHMIFHIVNEAVYALGQRTVGFAAGNLELAEIAWIRDFDLHDSNSRPSVSIGAFTDPDRELGIYGFRASDAQSAI